MTYSVIVPKLAPAGMERFISGQFDRVALAHSTFTTEVPNLIVRTSEDGPASPEPSASRQRRSRSSANRALTPACSLSSSTTIVLGDPAPDLVPQEVVHEPADDRAGRPAPLRIGCAGACKWASAKPKP